MSFDTDKKEHDEKIHILQKSPIQWTLLFEATVLMGYLKNYNGKHFSKLKKKVIRITMEETAIGKQSLT